MTWDGRGKGGGGGTEGQLSVNWLHLFKKGSTLRSELHISLRGIDTLSAKATHFFFPSLLLFRRNLVCSKENRKSQTLSPLQNGGKSAK